MRRTGSPGALQERCPTLDLLPSPCRLSGAAAVGSPDSSRVGHVGPRGDRSAASIRCQRRGRTSRRKLRASSSPLTLANSSWLQNRLLVWVGGVLLSESSRRTTAFSTVEVIVVSAR